jgi:tight adherence protein B
MMTLMLCCATLCAISLFWLVQAWFGRAVMRYRSVYTEQAGIRLTEVFLFIDPGQLWLMNVCLSIFSAAMVQMLSGSFVAALIAAALVSRLPQRAMRMLQSRRLTAFDGQLPDTLLALGSALRAGSSVSGALKHIVEHSDAPLSQELGLMLREQRLGIGFDAALTHLRERMPSEAAGLVVAALRIAAQTGGNLSDALDRIAETLRARLQLEARVRTLTAQGRMQAWIVGALPPFLVAVLYQLDPLAMSALWQTHLGWAVLAGVVVLETAGMLMIRRIVTIEI